MAGKRILVFQEKNHWAHFLRAALADLLVQVDHESRPAQAPAPFDKFLPHLLFIDPGFLSLALLQKIKVRKQTEPSFRVYQIGDSVTGKKGVSFDGSFQQVPPATDFKKHFADTLPAPEILKLLVVEDDEENGTMVRDYFEGQKAPAFVITCVPHGRQALKAIALERSGRDHS